MRDVSGEARLEKKHRRCGEFLAALTEGRGAEGVPDGTLTRITIRLPSEDDPETLWVVKATGSTGDKVAFIGGLDLCQALLTWAAKSGGKGLRWRDDIPWEAR